MASSGKGSSSGRRRYDPDKKIFGPPVDYVEVFGTQERDATTRAWVNCPPWVLHVTGTSEFPPDKTPTKDIIDTKNTFKAESWMQLWCKATGIGQQQIECSFIDPQSKNRCTKPPTSTQQGFKGWAGAHVFLPYQTNREKAWIIPTCGAHNHYKKLDAIHANMPPFPKDIKDAEGMFIWPGTKAVPINLSDKLQTATKTRCGADSEETRNAKGKGKGNSQGPIVDINCGYFYDDIQLKDLVMYK